MQTLAQDLLLLALDDEKGTQSWPGLKTGSYGLGGAVLMDLMLSERIGLAGGEVVVKDQTPTGDPVLDAALETIRASKEPRDAKHWVKKLGGKAGLHEQLARRLVERGILREQTHKYLWVFHEQRFPTSDPSPEFIIRDRIRDVALAGVEPDTRTLLLLSLVNACDLTDRLFSRDDRKQATQRIKDLVEGEQFGNAVGEAVSEMVAIIASTAATTTVVTSS